MKKLIKNFRTALIVSLAMFVICGFIYPMILTGVSQLMFPHQANGNLIEIDGKVVGSEFVGQDFTDQRLFHCRPSAYHYNTYTPEQKDEYSGLASGSHNYAPSNPALKERLEKDIETFLKENPTIHKEEIPSDIITASGSGLDPHISVEAAKVQRERVCQNTGLSQVKVDDMIKETTEGKVLGIFGEEKVNVLKLNLLVAKATHMIK